MTLTCGKRRLYAVRSITWLTEKEKEEIEMFLKQFGGDMVINEQDSPMKEH